MTRALLAAMIAAALFLTTAAGAAKAEDGYDLWLRYPPVEADAAADYRASARCWWSPASPRRWAWRRMNWSAGCRACWGRPRNGRARSAATGPCWSGARETRPSRRWGWICPGWAPRAM